MRLPMMLAAEPYDVQPVLRRIRRVMRLCRISTYEARLALQPAAREGASYRLLRPAHQRPHAPPIPRRKALPVRHIVGA
jgi:hypothetical protein